VLLGCETPDDIEERGRPATYETGQIIVGGRNGDAMPGEEFLGEVPPVPSQKRRDAAEHASCRVGPVIGVMAGDIRDLGSVCRWVYPA
jgi:hypothetical protein